nr:MAG TPA: hypothetical protein [Caudoviricetes sp.]
MLVEMTALNHQLPEPAVVYGISPTKLCGNVFCI